MAEYLGDRIRKARIKKQLTQRQMAEKLHVQTHTFCQYEKNKRNPDIQKIKMIAKVLEVSSDYLLGLEEDTNILENKNIKILLEKFKKLNENQKKEVLIFINQINKEKKKCS